MTIEIRYAQSSDIPHAARTLTSAFESYPWTQWSIPRDSYRQRLFRLQYIYLSHAVANGLVVVSNELDAVAAILPPGCPDLKGSQQSEVANLMGSRFKDMSQVKLPKRPTDSWHFATLGVQPKQTGHGLGTALIQECLDQVSRSSTPQIGLETSTKSNVNLYSKHGFELVHETHVKKGLVVYSMLYKDAGRYVMKNKP